jgi:hypothetical protein
MGRSRALWVAVIALGAGVLAGCAASSESDGAPASTTASEPAPTTSAAAASAPYESAGFTPALTVEPPGWFAAAPVIDEPHFLTWVGDGVDVDRAVRFMSPVGVYDASAPDKQVGTLRPVPHDYLRYLAGLRKYGAELSDRSRTEVDGRPATLLTAGTTASLSGTLGCQGEGLTPDDCYGLQPYALLRLAVIDDHGTTLLAWARVLPGSPTRDADFAAFEDLLSTVHFR